MASNALIARQLEEIADLLELQDANPFRVRAYRNASRAVENHERPLQAMVEAGENVDAIKGVGKDIRQAIEEFVRDGRIASLEEARRKVPTGLIEVTHVQGVGPKRAKQLHRDLGITSLEGLEAAAKEGRIAALSGFGEKTQQRILQGVDAARRFGERHVRADAERALRHLLQDLERGGSIERLEIAGSYRRGRETVGDADVLVQTSEPAAVMERLKGFEEVASVAWSGEDKTTVTLDAGLQVDVRAVPAESFGAALLYFTGSKEHNVALRQRALSRGWSLSEYGLTEEDGDARLAGATEEEIYRALGLPWIPPELREARGEIEAAESGTLPSLLTLEDLRADLHMHTDWSDGRATLREMIEAARDRGREIVAITDHSPALAMTGGLSPEKLRRQWAELDGLLPEIEGITVLRGMEVDILADGQLDMEEALLEEMDVVIASVHSRFQLDEATQTERVLRAVRHPLVNVLAHPTGRLINARDPFPIDLEPVIAAAAENRVALEINASPSRLDLNDVHARAAARAGAMISINTDAHAIRELDLLEHGVRVARRAWLEPRQVINTWPIDELRRFLRKEAQEP